MLEKESVSVLAFSIPAISPASHSLATGHDSLATGHDLHAAYRSAGNWPGRPGWLPTPVYPAREVRLLRHLLRRVGHGSVEGSVCLMVARRGFYRGRSILRAPVPRGQTNGKSRSWQAGKGRDEADSPRKR